MGSESLLFSAPTFVLESADGVALVFISLGFASPSWLSAALSPGFASAAGFASGGFVVSTFSADLTGPFFASAGVDSLPDDLP